ncbi:peptidoglycan DD-metalloendopeptidase family protein [Macrococcus capreoli]|uniref:peptidoglycan DD-metalloendopeptidase family protein n=1 Tax=Macrococcus capreoli TaxID=2982690 RepID=UPI0021D5C3AE|nr:peptidoglycan DD-metalloendopeptidase family protein [Macrococcus sp. TMW 2.2395]MCU7557642.1 peptidoglycan DD-metalloendopeptidase family protein [Macrococcus sp. TMW 2.2395]
MNKKIKFAIFLKLLPLILPLSILFLFILIVLGVSMSSLQQKENMNENDCTGGDISKNKMEDIFEKNAKGGALEGKGKFIVDTSKKFKVPPKIAIAIVAMESGWGHGANATNQNNPYSVMGNKSIHDSKFPTIENGIEVGIKNLYELYISEGLNTPEKIGPKYAPVGASNDPTNLNANWIPAVKETVEQLSSKGDKDIKCTASGSIKNIGSPVAKELLSRVTCKIGDYPGHPGIDLALSEGTPIYSIGNGKVTETIDVFTSGGASPFYMGKDNHITIMSDENNSIYMTYRHLKFNGIKVKKGDKVKAGELIGYSGNTGFTTGAHLHLEVLRDNKYSVSNAIDWYSPLVKKFKVKSDGLGCGL